MRQFDFIGGALCLDFLNTLHSVGAEDPGEELGVPEDLFRWAWQAGVLTESDWARVRKQCSRHPDYGRAILIEAKTLRASLRSMLERALPKRGVTPHDIELLNGLLSEFPATARIERHSGRWQTRWYSESDNVRKIFYEVLRSAAELISRGQLSGVRECASPTCTWMFVDTSKNHTRRWCDMRVCGNREKIRRFRQRMGKTGLASPKRAENIEPAE